MMDAHPFGTENKNCFQIQETPKKNHEEKSKTKEDLADSQFR